MSQMVQVSVYICVVVHVYNQERGDGNNLLQNTQFFHALRQLGMPNIQKIWYKQHDPNAAN